MAKHRIGSNTKAALAAIRRVPSPKVRRECQPCSAGEVATDNHPRAFTLKTLQESTRPRLPNYGVGLGRITR